MIKRDFLFFTCQETMQSPHYSYHVVLELELQKKKKTPSDWMGPPKCNTTTTLKKKSLQTRKPDYVVLHFYAGCTAFCKVWGLSRSEGECPLSFLLCVCRKVWQSLTGFSVWLTVTTETAASHVLTVGKGMLLRCKKRELVTYQIVL